MFLSVIGTDVSSKVRPGLLLFLTVRTLKFDVLEVQRLHVVRDDVFEMMHFLTQVTLPQRPAVRSRHLLHVGQDRKLQHI